MVMRTSRALIVDSHKPVCELIAAILRSAGFVTQTAYTLTQAFAQLESANFDLILADYQTASTGDSPFAPPLLARAKEQNDAVRIVLMSGNLSLEEASDYLFLAKPFTYRELLNKSGALALDKSCRSAIPTLGYRT